MVYQKDRRRPSKQHHAARVVIRVYTHYTHGLGNDLIRHNDDDCSVSRIEYLCIHYIIITSRDTGPIWVHNILIYIVGLISRCLPRQCLRVYYKTCII